jgi:hypothetical protein
MGTLVLHIYERRQVTAATEATGDAMPDDRLGLQRTIYVPNRRRLHCGTYLTASDTARYQTVKPSGAIL